MHGGVIKLGDIVGVVNGAGLEQDASIIESADIATRRLNITNDLLGDGDGFRFAFVIGGGGLRIVGLLPCGLFGELSLSFGLLFCYQRSAPVIPPAAIEPPADESKRDDQGCCNIKSIG